MHLSNIFKFTQSLGQNGHQIGRKVGDAIEVLTLGAIYNDDELVNYLEIEQGIEGATTAKHKVEFAFYKNRDEQSLIPENLFGLIECKKVGVEQTIKQNYKVWNKRNTGKKFFETEGYGFTFNPSGVNKKYSVLIKPSEILDTINIEIVTVTDTESIENREIECFQGKDILFVLDENADLKIISPANELANIAENILKCVVLQIKEIRDGRVHKIFVNESLAGPQTPEKAKQASFVSLDVRKRVLGRFDKTEDKSFISVLVIGEASHWEEKSRSMVRLCNDFNVIVPDEVVIEIFKRFKDEYGELYQSKITKAHYQQDERARSIIADIISSFEGKVLRDMETDAFVEFHINSEDTNIPKLTMREVF